MSADSALFDGLGSRIAALARAGSQASAIFGVCDFSSQTIPPQLETELERLQGPGLRLWHHSAPAVLLGWVAGHRKVGGLVAGRARAGVLAWTGNDERPASVLAPLVEGSVDSIKDLEHGLAVCCWHADEQEMSLATDRYGNAPVYYHWDGSRLAFGTSAAMILALLGARARLNRSVLGELVWFGHPVGEATLFEGINKVPPATVLRFSSHGCGQTRYWALRFRPGRRDALPEAEEALHQAVVKASSGDRVAMGLSGGMDSRAILAELAGAGKKVTAFTAGVPDATDMRIAGRLAQGLGMDHHRVALDDRFLQDLPRCARELVRLCEGALGVEHSHLVWLDEECAGHFSALIDGGGAEICKRAFLRRRSKRAKSVAELPALVARVYGRPGLAAALLSKDEFAATEQRVTALLGVRLADVEHATVGDTLDACFIRVNWPNFYARAFALQSGFLEGRLPFLDYRFVDLMSEVPQSQRARIAIHFLAIERRAPALLKYGRAFGGVEVPFTEAILPKYGVPALNRLLKTLGLSGFDRHAFPYAEWFTSGRLSEAGKAARALADRGLFDRDRLLRAIAPNAKPGLAFQAALLAWRLELWHRIFIEGTNPQTLRPS